MQSSQDQQLERLVRLAVLATGADWGAIRLAADGPMVLAARLGAVQARADLAQEALSASGAISRKDRLGAYAAAPLFGANGQRLGVIEVGGAMLSDARGLEDAAALVAELLTNSEDAARTAREADHRIKNILASVQSLAQHSARQAGSVESLLKTFNGRLKAMASAQDLLSASRTRGATLGDLAEAELGALPPGQVRWQGPDIALSPRAAQALSLALHELAANAQQHGALTIDGGRVELIWQHMSDGGFCLEWLETGGPQPQASQRRGFGLNMIEKAAPRELDGRAKLDFAPGGLRVQIAAGPGAKAAGSPAAPVEVEAAQDRPAPASPGHRVEGLRVLVVEDSILLALELEAGLSAAGAEVVGTAAEVEQAIALLSMPIDAVVLDANLNGRSAQPVAQALIARGIPFVVATGFADAISPLGFDAPVIRKPYNINQIVAALAQLPPPGQGVEAA